LTPPLPEPTAHHLCDRYVRSREQHTALHKRKKVNSMSRRRDTASQYQTIGMVDQFSKLWCGQVVKQGRFKEETTQSARQFRMEPQVISRITGVRVSMMFQR
jgi:hypothetical protein